MKNRRKQGLSKAKQGMRAVTLGLLLLIAALAACVPLPADSNWGHLSLLEYPGANNVMMGVVALPFHDQLTLVDPMSGLAVQLRDTQGNIRPDEQGNPRRWTVSTGGRCIPDCFYSAPTQINDDTLLVPGYNKRLLEIDLLTARLSSIEGRPVDGHIVGSPLVTEDSIYVPFSERDIVALNRSDYSVRWRFDTERGVWATPLLVDGLLIVPSMDHNLYALDAQRGTLVWSLNLGGAVGMTPLLHEGELYAGSFAGRVFRISLNGEIRASFDGAQEWIWATPTIVDGVLYVGDTNGFVYALAVEANGFRQVWSRQVGTRAIRATPVVYRDTLIVAGRDRTVYWLNRDTGEELLRRELNGEILADMLVVEPSETIMIPEPFILISTMARDQALVAFSLDDGERRWVYGF
jgi:outer membrane protein assembly factor BamB